MTYAAIAATGGETFDFGGFGVTWKIEGRDTDQRFSVVHRPLAPHALAPPLHRHHHDDELSYVLSGTLLGSEVATVPAGTWVRKPRLQWHTFWNAGETQCESIEIISPAGFENYFREVAATWRDVA